MKWRLLVTYAIAFPAIGLLLFFSMVPDEADTSRFAPRFYGVRPELSAAWDRYLAMADTARALTSALTRLDTRARAQSVASHRSGLLVRGDSGVSAAALEGARTVASEELAALGAAEPKHPIAIIVMIDTRSSYPPYERGIVLPTEPDAPCTVVLRLAYRHAKFARIGNADRLLGPCGFYAVFGAPGRGIRAWLEETELVAAAFLQWPRSLGDGVIHEASEANAAGRATDVAACRAGRRDGCERLFTLKSDESERRFLDQRRVELTDVPSTPGVSVFSSMDFMRRRTAFTAGMLAALSTELGPERFARIWQSDEDPLTAYEQAEGRPLAEWIAERVEQTVKVYHAGPSVGAVQWVSFVLLLGAVVGATLRLAPGRLT